MREWRRVDSTGGWEFLIDVGDIPSRLNDVRDAIAAGMRITVHANGEDRGLVSLSALKPIIHQVEELCISVAGRLTDVEVLGDAWNLRSLDIEISAADGRAELSELPNLEQFSGSINRVTASVLRNPRLRFLSVLGAIPRSFARVAGPVESFMQEGARAQTELPVFAQPDAMRSIGRIGPARFDIRQLSEMTGLREFSLGACGEVEGLSLLSGLPALARLEFRGVSTREDWEDLPSVSSALIWDISPYPSAALLGEWRLAGWSVPADSPDERVAPLSSDVAGDGESWGVYMSRFEDLAEAVEAFDGSVAHGLHGEQFILGVVAELRASGEQLAPEPDSESGLTAVYFPTREQAERVYERAREMLDAGPARQLELIRAGS